MLSLHADAVCACMFVYCVCFRARRCWMLCVWNGTDAVRTEQHDDDDDDDGDIRAYEKLARTAHLNGDGSGNILLASRVVESLEKCVCASFAIELEFARFQRRLTARQERPQPRRHTHETKTKPYARECVACTNERTQWVCCVCCMFVFRLCETPTSTFQSCKRTDQRAFRSNPRARVICVSMLRSRCVAELHWRIANGITRGRCDEIVCCTKARMNAVSGEFPCGLHLRRIGRRGEHEKEFKEEE